MTDYAAFLSSKRREWGGDGVTLHVEDLPAALYPFQRALTAWALRKGRAALFADTGLGKTFMQVAWAEQIPGRVLILAPLCVGAQTMTEARKLGITVLPFGSGGRLEVLNYEMLHHVTPTDYSGVVLDECFAGNTPIDTPNGIVYIKDIQRGQAILNAIGEDVVVAVIQREVNAAVAINISGQRIICSPNHPWLTGSGWQRAFRLRPGDQVVATAEAMRVVRGAIHGQIRASRQDQILRAILFSEMADASARDCCQGSYSGDSREDRREGLNMATRDAKRETPRASFCGNQAHADTWDASADIGYSTADGSSPSVEWWQGTRHHAAARATAGGAWGRMGSRTPRRSTAPTEDPSILLLSRPRESEEEDRGRSRWRDALYGSGEGSRREEGDLSPLSRVDGVEILEPGDPRLECLRAADGKLHFYDLQAFRHPSFSVAGALVHNSSILKSFDGRTRGRLIEMFKAVRFRLCCTATPAPNDIAELANHCEFLGIMTRAEMLATFFVHTDDANQRRAGWRLKRHAYSAFYRWLASWGMFLRRPSDLGFSDDGYDLPPLSIHDLIVTVDGAPQGEYLFPTMGLGGIRGRSAARRGSLKPRADAVVSLVERTPGQWIVWCGLNDEQDTVAKALDGDCISIAGPDTPEEKQARLDAFIAGRVRVLITKSRIAGFGLNLQGCSQMAFLGLGDSYETYYQAIRRCWRYGQTRPVNVHVVVSEGETEIVMNVRKKEQEAGRMAEGLIAAVRDLEREEIGVTVRQRESVSRAVASGEAWTLHQGDCVEVLREQAAASVDFSVYSPPFIALYTYTNSERDVGNCSTREEFLEHFGYVVRELLRVTKPGRLTACHIAQTTSQKAIHGVIGLVDLRGAVIECFSRNDWIYHGEVCIDKDPQAQAIRTKSKALLFVQLRKDASWLRPALADYILVFRAPGDNAVPIHPDITNEDWIEWARPIWYGIRESDTLNVREGRGNDDERHICLAAGSLVLTRERGYVPIESINLGERVLTHEGRWQPVIGKQCNGDRPTIDVCAQGVARLRVTADHKLWTRIASGDKAKKSAATNDPRWVPANETLGSYLNLKLPPVEDSALTTHEWWIVGRYLGDGHRGGHKRSGKRGGVGQFLISCSHEEAPALIARLGEHAGHRAKITATQIALKNLRRSVRDVMGRCGRGAAGKRLPGEAVMLAPEKAEALLSGYLSADGHHVGRHDRWTASSVSRALLLGMALVAQRARGVVASVYAGRPERTGTIEGRQVAMAQDWVFGFRNSDGYRKSGWIGRDGAWKKVRKLEEAVMAEVWDISVAEDASFTAEGAIVKNCPLQLGTIERCVRLWSNPGETVLSPFAGIGSEGYEAVRLGRRFIGIELKPEYWRAARKNLARVETLVNAQGTLL